MVWLPIIREFLSKNSVSKWGLVPYCLCLCQRCDDFHAIVWIGSDVFLHQYGWPLAHFNFCDIAQRSFWPWNFKTLFPEFGGIHIGSFFQNHSSNLKIQSTSSVSWWCPFCRVIWLSKRICIEAGWKCEVVSCCQQLGFLFGLILFWKFGNLESIFLAWIAQKDTQHDTVTLCC